MKKQSKLETSINSITKPLCNMEIDLSGSLFDFYTDTFSPEFTYHDREDLKSVKILFPLVFSYHVVYMAIFAALFYFSYQQNIGTIFLSPFDKNHGTECTAKYVSKTESFKIDRNGIWEGQLGYDKSKPVYTLVANNMNMDLIEYNEMIKTFNDDYNKLGDKSAKRDSVFNKVAYSSFRSKYYGKSGGTIDLYTQGDASVIFNRYNQYETQFLSRDDICFPYGMKTKYTKESSTLSFSFPVDDVTFLEPCCNALEIFTAPNNWGTGTTYVNTNSNLNLCSQNIAPNAEEQVGGDAGIEWTQKFAGSRQEKGKALMELDVRSMATVLAVNNGVLPVSHLTKLLDFEDFFKDWFLDIGSNSGSTTDNNIQEILKNKMSFYKDDHYPDMQPIICAEKDGHEVCGMLTGNSQQHVVIPVGSNKGFGNTLNSHKGYGSTSSCPKFGPLASNTVGNVTACDCPWDYYIERCTIDDSPDCEFMPSNQGTLFGYKGEYYIGFIFLPTKYYRDTNSLDPFSFHYYTKWSDILFNIMSSFPENYDDIFAQKAHDILKLPTNFWNYKHAYESYIHPYTGRSYSLVQDPCVVYKTTEFIDNYGSYSYHNYDCTSKTCCGYDYSTSTPSSSVGDHEYGVWDLEAQNNYKHFAFDTSYFTIHYSADTKTCPDYMDEYLRAKFDNLCGPDLGNCSMIQMSFSSNIASRDTLNLVYGHPISSDPYTASYFEGSRDKNKEQIFHPKVFEKMMNNPPFTLSESVMECKTPVYQALIDTFGITISNTAIFSSLFLTIAIALAVHSFNSLTNKHKRINPVDKKSYVSKQAMFALFELIFQQIEKDENVSIRSKHQYEDLLHLLDSTDQVDRLPIDEVISHGQSVASTGRLPPEVSLKRLEVLHSSQKISRQKRSGTVRPEVLDAIGVVENG